MSVLSEPHFHNATAATARLEAMVWPSGPFCPRCGGFDRITPVGGGRGIAALRAMRTRIHGYGWHHFRGQPYQTASLVSGCAFDGIQQEGHPCPSDTLDP